MNRNQHSVPHSVKRWQLSGTDYKPQQVQNLRTETRFSSWTPLNHQQSNIQLFEERLNLVLRWFDLWTDRQRKLLLHSLLSRCTTTQLKFCRDQLMEAVPVTQLDFTSVLPRFLSLYVMSFLSPLDLCRAAQVSWHWRVLAEQDCLWAGRCIRRGWFLPYTPVDKEFGAWKNHYVFCVSTLDLLSPRQAAEMYGPLKQQNPGREEEEERRKERRMREMIREKIQEEKRVSLRTRRAWGSSPRPDRSRGGGSQSGRFSSGVSSISGPLRSVGSSTLSLDRRRPTAEGQSLGRVQAFSLSSDSLTRSSTSRPALSPSHAPLLLLVSNRTPAYELLLSGVTSGVMVVLYDHRGTLAALLAQVERAVCGRPAQRLGLLAPGGTEEINLLYDCSLSERTLQSPDQREFWEKLCGWVVTTSEGGGMDIFCPLAASASGRTLIQRLSTLTGLEVRAPMGLATGSFQNILSEWSASVGSGLSNQQPAAPALQYVNDAVLQFWCQQAQWMEEVLMELRDFMGPQIQQISLQTRGRALGYFLCDKMCLEKLCVSKDLSDALTEGLTALSRQEETRPLEFLLNFLTRWSKEEEQQSNGEDEGRSKGGDSSSGSQKSETSFSLMHALVQTPLDWRESVVRELHHSECLYLSRLRAVMKVYQDPLTAALNSSRAILSYTDIQIILSPVGLILELHSVFEADLQVRLKQWGPEQCVGDVFVKFCSKLKVYSNYLNNYTTALCTIDKIAQQVALQERKLLHSIAYRTEQADQCRENKPSFRAFLKRADRTLATHMFSLQELLLCPVWRIQEYVTLLQALIVHTNPEHPDQPHLSSALSTLQSFKEFIQKLKRNSEADRLIEETQKLIQGCPNLKEGNRQLIISQDAALLRSPDEQIPDSLRAYEQVCDVGLFLFNDALVLTRRNLHHTPFRPAHRCTHTFLASVDVGSLDVREITYNRYVSNAFVLQGPRRSWVCATESGEERQHFLFVLRSAMRAALRGQQ